MIISRIFKPKMAANLKKEYTLRWFCRHKKLIQWAGENFFLLILIKDEPNL